MEWTAKWDWENTKEMQLAADWVIVDDGDIHGGSFNLSGHASTSISASTPNYSNFSEGMGFSTTPDSSVGSSEALLLGLKLGKRTYFENTVMPTPSPSTIIMKKTKSSSAQNSPPPPICCQVEGCNIDLSKAKEYHRKHRVCETHSKCPRVIVGGRDRRFCQQCSRFHSLTEFDEKKRSCRRRLSDHNARRRKPHQETIHFDPPTHTHSHSHSHSTPYYGGNQEMSFVLNNSAFRTPGNCCWDSACNTSKFTLTQGQGYSNNDQQLHMKPPQGMQNSANRLKNSTSLVSNSAAAEVGRALSLLSTNSWDSCEPESIPLHHQSILQPPQFHAGVPLSDDYWLTHPHIPNFQEIQLFKTPYDANFYSNVLN